MARLFFILLCFGLELSLHAKNPSKIKETNSTQTEYHLTDALIDVVIVSHKKDQETLDQCIEGLQKNCDRLGRIIVVSAEPLTQNAEWFDEKEFPFDKQSVTSHIAKGNLAATQKLFERTRSVGWYYQQLLKLYSAFVIPDISPNVLVCDADTIFLNPVEFLNEEQGGFFCVSPHPAMQRYLKHAARLLPGFKRIHPEHYGVCHHMLFQKPILKDLFKVVEQHHNMPFWKAFCACVNIQEGGASEYELYYNFALSRTNQVELRPLKWTNSAHLEKMNSFKKNGYHFVSFHTYLREG